MNADGSDKRQVTKEDFRLLNQPSWSPDGHFIVAKIFGMRVEAYSFFGLGPRVLGFKIGHTDYRISAIPLGAYVKLYGDEGAGPLEAKDE